MAIVVALNNKRQSRAGLSCVINYVGNDKKTLLQSGEKLVSGINCSPHSAYNEFMLTKHLHSKANGRYFYHYCQSFSPEEKVTPKTVHEIGVRLAKECFDGCEVIVGTHIEKIIYTITSSLTVSVLKVERNFIRIKNRLKISELSPIKYAPNTVFRL